MRIDYSPPRRSPTPSLSTAKQRSSYGSTLRFVMLIASLGLLLFGIGFGSGWYFSQQSTKQAFRAAMEQQSLESSPKEEQVSPAPVPGYSTCPGCCADTAGGCCCTGADANTSLPSRRPLAQPHQPDSSFLFMKTSPEARRTRFLAAVSMRKQSLRQLLPLPCSQPLQQHQNLQQRHRSQPRNHPPPQLRLPAGWYRWQPSRHRKKRKTSKPSWLPKVTTPRLWRHT